MNPSDRIKWILVVCVEYNIIFNDITCKYIFFLVHISSLFGLELMLSYLASLLKSIIQARNTTILKF